MAKSGFNKFVYVCMGMIFSATTLFISCATTTKTITPVSPTQSIQTTNQDLTGVTSGLTNSTAQITQDAQTGLAATPASAMPALQPKWQDILLQAGYQNGMIANLKQAQTQLTAAQAQSQSLEDAYNASQAALAKAQSSATANLQKAYTWASLACLGLLVLAVIAGVSGLGGGNLSTIAYAVAVGSAVGLGICIFLIQTVSWIPWVIGGIALICGGVVIYRFFHKNTTITTTTATANAAAAKVADLSTQTAALASLTQGLKEENQTLTTTSSELVHTVEAAKPFMTIKGRRAVFGDGPIPGVAHVIQTPSTRAFVSSARQNLQNVAPSIPETITSDLVLPDAVVSNEVDDEEYKAEVYATKPDTRSVRARNLRRADVFAGKSTVVVIR